MRCVWGWRWGGRGSGSWRWRRLGRWMRRPASGGSTLAVLMLGRVRRASASMRGGRRGGFRLRLGGFWRGGGFLAAGGGPGGFCLTSLLFRVAGGAVGVWVPRVGRLWAAIARGEVPALTARGTSFRRWSQRLELRAQDAACVGELSFWSEQLSAPSLSLVDGSLDPARDTMGTAGRLTLTLPVALTQAL